jgi:hypothetical protein
MPLIITFKIHKMAFKMSFAATCFGLTRPSSGIYQLVEIITLYGLTRQYYHAVTARRRVWEMYARTSLTLPLCTAFTLCSLCVVFLGQAWWSSMSPLALTSPTSEGCANPSCCCYLWCVCCVIRLLWYYGCLNVGVLISLWLFLFPILLFAPQPKEFFLVVLN